MESFQTDDYQALQISFSHTNNDCYNEYGGSIEPSISGGVPPYIFTGQIMIHYQNLTV